MPRVLFVRTDRLGETLLNLPALHSLRRTWPETDVTLMVNPALRELLDGHPDATSVIAEPAGAGPWWWNAWGLSRVWRRLAPDVAIISNPKREYHLAAWLAGIPRRVGYDRKWAFLLTHRVAPRPALGGGHEVEYNQALLRALGFVDADPLVLQLPVDEAVAARIRRAVQERGIQSHDPLVAVHPWTSNPRKQWPVERFISLARCLADRPGVHVAVIGGPEQTQASRAAVMPALVGALRVHDLVGRFSLRETAELLRLARVCVSNDSGPVHLAAAVGTPVVALFGTADAGSVPQRWGPWGRGHTVLHQPLDRLEVDEVVRAVLPYLP